MDTEKQIKKPKDFHLHLCRLRDRLHPKDFKIIDSSFCLPRKEKAHQQKKEFTPFTALPIKEQRPSPVAIEKTKPRFYLYLIKFIVSHLFDIVFIASSLLCIAIAFYYGFAPPAEISFFQLVTDLSKITQSIFFQLQLFEFGLVFYLIYLVYFLLFFIFLRRTLGQIFINKIID